jgi:hypothetical protein
MMECLGNGSGSGRSCFFSRQKVNADEKLYKSRLQVSLSLGLEYSELACSSI